MDLCLLEVVGDVLHATPSQLAEKGSLSRVAKVASTAIFFRALKTRTFHKAERLVKASHVVTTVRVKLIMLARRSM